jgi:predicted phage-related endonuclease
MKLEGIPVNYVIQMQHYLAITGCAWGRFIIFNADSWEMVTVDVEAFGPTELAGYIDILAQFWNAHVIPQVPPPQEQQQRMTLPKVSGTLKERDDPDFKQAVEALVNAQQSEKEAKSLVEAAKGAVLDAINRENGVYESDDYRVYYTPVDGRVTFDRKALAASRPIDGAKLMGVLSDMGHGDLVPQLAERADDFVVDLSQYETRGDDFSTLRIYPRKKGGNA